MNILVDSDNIVLKLRGKHFRPVKSVHMNETNDELQDKEVENNEKKTEKTEEDKNEEMAEEREPLILYTSRGGVHDKVDLSKVEVNYYGEGILRESLKERKEMGPTRIEISGMLLGQIPNHG